MSFCCHDLQRMVGRGWRFTPILGLTILLAGGFLQSRIAAEDRADKPASEKRMLLLYNGRTVEGKILKSSDNYIVKKENGEVLVPLAMVKLECVDLNDAYRLLRKNLSDTEDVEGHLDLARWCLNSQLVVEARDEVRTALAIDPSREDVRAFLAKLNEVVDPKPARPPTSPAEKSHALKSSPFSPEDIESLQGLSRASAQHYVRRIQPILMNNCMLTGCHGTESQNGLRLQRVRGGSDANRSVAEQNLASILRFVSMETPKKSPLLLVPNREHGRKGREIFAGARGAEQSQEIRDWVVTLSKEASKKKKKQTKAVDDDEEGQKPAYRGFVKGERPSATAAAATGKAPSPEGVAREMLDLPPNVDPFSPDAFNKQPR